ncbi:MAG: 1,4-alpha-glucan branching protein GlgB [Clostridia bacterium]|nr:1,4-alpha-glucan branching protein GlgB [Clostridia bacterium]
MSENLDYPSYLFHAGTNYESYKLFCPQPTSVGKERGYTFRLWAPFARSVSVVGDFNGWDPNANVMHRCTGDFFEAFLTTPKVYDRYKYAVTQADGNVVYKADPFALHTETPPGNCSKIYKFRHKWKDAEYMARRENYSPYNAPINIYEVHLGSWRRHEDGNVYSYKDLAKTLVPYVKQMGYTHVEFMPVTEYPFDGSWGYQVTGMFAPTSRYGTPDDFMELIDAFHRAGIGVIVDWVPAHFPKDEYGLYKFDGTFQYEYQSEKKREHKEWGTVVYDYGKPQVRSFLISSAMFWFDLYHVDGIRMDAVASMLYLDYARQGGDWERNCFGGNYNLEAIDFLKQLNSAVLSKHKGGLMIAEESTAFPKVTKPPYMDGLGFNFKWNMGWMNDTLRYVSEDPFFRQYKHGCMTFSLMYAFSENFILPLSHDEVVHGKGSLINKMAGDYDEKFKSLKTYFGYMMAHPGKKLLFMGGEFAQFAEWKYYQGLDWMLLDYPAHKNMQTYVKALNEFYKREPAFFECDTSYDGFRWAVVDDNTQNIFAFNRIAANGDSILCVFNMSPITRYNYKIGVREKGRYNVVLDSESKKFGGPNDKFGVTAQVGECHGEKFYLEMHIPAYSATFFKKSAPRKKKENKE